MSVAPTQSPEITDLLRDRAAAGGGFADRAGGPYRPDATAWACLALRAANPAEQPSVQGARDRLAAGQLADGRVALDAAHPQAAWPTALAALAWIGAPEHRDPLARALDFLVRSSGERTRRADDDTLAHDARLEGWPWIEGTFSWVEPTATALMALRAARQATHPRADQARRLLLDRQLPSGGWNYGNTLVFDREMEPTPDSTGIALASLAGAVEPDAVRASLDYLRRALDSLGTPLALGWTLIGLSAWGERPADAEARIVECIERQGRFGGYATSHLSILPIARHSVDGAPIALAPMGGAA